MGPWSGRQAIGTTLAQACSQWHSQWVTGTVGSVEPRWIILVRGAPLSQAIHCHHTRPKGQGNHSSREVVRGTLEQAWSVGATQVVGSVESHPGQSQADGSPGDRTSHGESSCTAQGVRREGDAARVSQPQATEYQVVSVALCVNVALRPRMQPDSTPGPFPSHTLLGQLQLEGGTAPLNDGHIF